MFSPLARGKAGWDGGVEYEGYCDQTVRPKLLFFFHVEIRLARAISLLNYPRSLYAVNTCPGQHWITKSSPLTSLSKTLANLKIPCFWLYIPRWIQGGLLFSLSVNRGTHTRQHKETVKKGRASLNCKTHF